MTGLTDEELQAYRTAGWTGPFPLLDDARIAAILREYAGTRNQLPWYKGHHVFRGPIGDAITSPAVVDRVASVLGDDLMLWGSQVLSKRGGRTHRWHVDIETLAWRSVNVWVALRNVTARATVLLLPRTQHLEVSPQALASTEGLDVTDARAVRAAAARLGADADVVTVDIPPGNFVLFDGHLWHGSVNRTWRRRSALLAQYSPTTERARIPRTWTPPIEWSPEPAPCLLLRGRDLGGGNHYVTPVEPPRSARPILGVRQALRAIAGRSR